MKVALIGAGRMGSAMGARVAGAGHDLVVFNRTRSRAEDLAGRTEARVADSARDAAEFAEVCLVSLADDTAVTATYLDDNGLIAGLQPRAVVCDASTVAPATVRGLRPLVAQKDAILLDTPVSGSVSTVESGTLTVMVGGDQDALDRARPVLETFAKSIFHLGDIGAGATMKLVVNSLVHSLNVAVSEALVLAEKAGLDRETAYDIFEAGAAGAPYVKYKREAFLRPGEVPVAFSLDLVAKDQELIHDL
ncbi:MAG TPA: NAD(P)-dependent oxidoreductase, partial [Propionibacteriaceae bacterium]